MDVNHGIIYGRLTKDSVAGSTPNGVKTLEVSIANNLYIKESNYTNYFYFTLFGKTAENLEKYLKKGIQVVLQYRLKQDRWEKDGQKMSKISLLPVDIQIIWNSKSENSLSSVPLNNNSYDSSDITTGNTDFPPVDYPGVNQSFDVF